MKKVYWFIFILFFSFLFINNISYACSIIADNTFYIKTSNSDCYFWYSNQTNFSDIKMSDCDNLILSDNEKEFFLSIIRQLDQGRYGHYGPGHIYFEKQNNLEYISFQKSSEIANADICDCVSFTNITRYNDWTVYAKSRDCGHGTDCQPIPPKECSNILTRFLNIPTSYFIIPIIFLIVLFFYFIKKGRIV